MVYLQLQHCSHLQALPSLPARAPFKCRIEGHCCHAQHYDCCCEATISAHGSFRPITLSAFKRAQNLWKMYNETLWERY